MHDLNTINIDPPRWGILRSSYLPLSNHMLMQGMNDLFVGLASAAGSLGSGFVFAAVGYQIMGFVGAAFATLPLAVALWWRRNPIRRSAVSQAQLL